MWCWLQNVFFFPQFALTVLDAALCSSAWNTLKTKSLLRAQFNLVARETFSSLGLCVETDCYILSYPVVLRATMRKIFMPVIKTPAPITLRPTWPDEKSFSYWEKYGNSIWATLATFVCVSSVYLQQLLDPAELHFLLVLRTQTKTNKNVAYKIASRFIVRLRKIRSSMKK